MEFISDMDGNQPTFHSHVRVVNLSTLPGPFIGKKVVTTI